MQYKNDLIHGKGIEYYKTGNKKYEGDFMECKREGEGNYILKMVNIIIELL